MSSELFIVEESCKFSCQVSRL